jgi:hypothetical protein
MSYDGKASTFWTSVDAAREEKRHRYLACAKYRANHLVFCGKVFIFATISNEDRFDCLQPLQKC